MKVLALYQLKGGVGKTAAAFNLACLAADAGVPTLLWDLDPQGAASFLAGDAGAQDAGKPKALWSGDAPIAHWVQATARPNLSLIPAGLTSRHLDTWLRKGGDDTLAGLLAPLSEQFALCVLDCPPSLSHLADNVLRAADRVLLPVVPTPLSLRALRQVLDYCAEQGLPKDRLRAFWSLADRRRGLHRLLLETPPKGMPKLGKAVVPYSAVVERMTEHRAPVQDFAPEHPAAEAYRQLWRELRADLKP